MEKFSKKFRITPPLYKCIAVLCASLVAAFALTSCGNIGDGAPEGYGNVRVSFDGSSRNVTQADKDAATLKVYFNGRQVEKKDSVYEGLVESGTRLLITAEAVSADGKIIGKGEKTIIVKGGYNNVQMQVLTYDNFVVTIDGKSEGFTNFADAWNAVIAKTATLKMNADATIMSNSSFIAGNVTLDLNGHTLKGDGATNVVSISPSGTFILKDSGSGGKITGGGGNQGGGVNCSGNFIMMGGTITGNSTGNGGGVYVGNLNSTFTMKGGTIAGNTSIQDGSGVCVNIGTFIMDGGTISGNTAQGSGAGVYIGGSGTFTMNGGSISGNKSSANGGGVYVHYAKQGATGVGGTFNMKGGSISGNTAADGAGVYVSDKATYNHTGGTIADAVADKN